MKYLKSFTMPRPQVEYDFFARRRLNVYDSFYPFKIFENRNLPTFEFSEITIFYGGNGSGKTTLLNVMSEKLSLKRFAPFNRTEFFNEYVSYADFSLNKPIPEGSRIITSDDIFDSLLDVRAFNQGVDLNREELVSRYFEDTTTGTNLKSLGDFEQWKKENGHRLKSPTAFVKEYGSKNILTRSNGESALKYFADSIQEKALYLLDEPENSLSSKMQLELKNFLEDSLRFYQCQFVISTHSPILLSIPGAVIYNLDENPVKIRRWTELENVRIYYDFFKEHEKEF